MPCCRQAQDTATAARQQAEDLQRQLHSSQAQASRSQQDLQSSQAQVCHRYSMPHCCQTCQANAMPDASIAVRQQAQALQRTLHSSQAQALCSQQDHQSWQSQARFGLAMPCRHQMCPAMQRIAQLQQPSRAQRMSSVRRCEHSDPKRVGCKLCCVQAKQAQEAAKKLDTQLREQRDRLQRTQQQLQQQVCSRAL